MYKITSIGYEIEQLKPKAERLAQTLALRVDNHVLPRLCVTLDKLELLIEGCSPLFVDFSFKRWQKRHHAGKKQGLVRACKPRHGLRILDATAGWGRDAVILASFGATVLMLERHLIMAALLADGLSRYYSAINYPSDLSHSRLDMSLLQMDTKDYLQRLKPIDYPDVIYIDPMHPLRQKSALVKKDLQALQQLIGEDQDAKELLDLALTRSLNRVVVKWPQQLVSLQQPDLFIQGKTVRFDIYLSTLEIT